MPWKSRSLSASGYLLPASSCFNRHAWYILLSTSIPCGLLNQADAEIFCCITGRRDVDGHIENAITSRYSAAWSASGSATVM